MTNTTKEIRQYTKVDKDYIYDYLKRRGFTDLQIAYYLVHKENRKIAALPKDQRLKRAFTIATTDEINGLLASISRIEFGNKIVKFNKNYSLFTREQPNRTNNGNLTHSKKKKRKIKRNVKKKILKKK